MVTVIAVVVGALLGGVWSDGFNALVGGLMGWLILRSYQQSRELKALRAEVVSQPRAVDAQLVADELPKSTELEPSQSPSPSPSPSTLSPEQPVPVAEALKPIVMTARPPAAPAPPAALHPNPLAPLKAWLFGGNTIVKAGIGILFIGLAFLAKYASEHTQVPVEYRLAGIGLVAIVLLVLGWRLRARRPGYAQVLQGGAVAVLYLTLFVAFRFYGVIGIGPVFATMVVVAALAAALAVLQDARSLAVIGALGGFATPLLVSSGGGNAMALFGYYLVLDLGIAAVAWFRTWRSLNLIGFVFTFGIGTAWGVLDYRADQYAGSQAFLIAFFLLFAALLVLPLRRHEPQSGIAGRIDAMVPSSLLFGLPTITFVLQHGLVRDSAFGTALSALVLAAFYVGLSLWLRRRPGAGITFEGSLAVAIVFLTLVIPFALDARSTAGAWALEAAALVWLGLRQARVMPRVFGYLLFLMSALSMAIGHAFGRSITQVFDASVINALIAAAGALTAAFVLHAQAERARPVERPIGALLIGLATLWLWAAAASPIDAFVDNVHQLSAWLVALSALAVLYVALAVRLSWRGIAQPTLALAPLLLIAAAASAATQSSPVVGGGWWAWPIAAIAHLLCLRLAAPRWPVAAVPVVHGLGAITLAVLGALQGSAVTADWGDAASAWRWLGWLAFPAALLLWLPLPSAARRWPVSAAPSAYQTAGAGLLSAGALAWTWIANLASNGGAQPLPYVPLANPLDLGVAVALIAAWRWQRSDAATPVLGQRHAAALALLAASAFLWLNAILLRGFHHYAGVPYQLDAWTDTLAVQTGLTLLWAVTALASTWWSARRGQRVPWLVGAGLLVAVVAKLLLVDLSGSGTVTRIVSFIGVGVLMLVIGYVAPLPGKNQKTETSDALA